MKVYFVRHGSTNSLENNISQPNQEPLNEKGLSQAKELANRFSHQKIDLIISSSHLRAVQTAQAISPKFVTSPLFVEVKKPSEVVGKSKDTQDIKNILNKIHDMYLVNTNWHYSDEENFEDIKKRSLSALKFLESQNQEDILVVSHGNFIVFLIGLMMFGQDFTAPISLNLRKFFRLSNTGVSICSYEENKWKLQCWNDTSHRLE